MTESTPEQWVLAIDSARKGIALSLFPVQGGTELRRDVPTARGEALAMELESLLDEAGLLLKSVTAVVVTLGPGSFTGLRTGIAFCQGLCAAGHRKLYGISSLAFMRAQWSAAEAGSVGVLCHARPGYLYVGSDLGQWPHLEHGAKLSQEAFIGEAEGAQLLAPCVRILADRPRPTEGPLASLPGEWVDLTTGMSLAVLQPLLGLLTPSMLWNANYLQPSYAEQATPKA